MKKSIQFLCILILCVFTIGKAQTSYQKSLIEKYITSCIAEVNYWTPYSKSSPVDLYNSFFGNSSYTIDKVKLKKQLNEVVNNHNISDDFFIGHVRAIGCIKQNLYGFIKATKDNTNADFNAGDLTEFILSKYAYICEEKEQEKILKEKQDSINTKKQEVFSIVDEMPEFKGGQMELMKFIGKNMVYPDSAKANQISGKVYLKFTITETGNVENILITKGIRDCKACDDEAIKVIKLTNGIWKAGKQQGKAVSVLYNYSINFTLK